MFDFAISRNQRRLPTKRLYASWIASSLAHLAMLLVLVHYPQLLQGGKYHRFRIPLLSIFQARQPDVFRDNRVVTVLRPMTAPSAETLKKLLYDWSRKGEGDVPPIRLRWGKEQRALLEQPKAPKPGPSPAPPAASAPGSSQGSQSAAAPGESSPVPAIVAQNDPTKRATVNLPAPSTPGASAPPPAGTESASAVAPASIPKPQAGKQPPLQVFENEQQAMKSPQAGLFGTMGFPLGEYATLIVERIKGNWFIPSNLRNSQGHTTVIFFIGRDGHFSGARIVTSSGSQSLDFAALNAIIGSNPFPALPKGFPGDRIGAKFVFSYNEPQ